MIERMESEQKSKNSETPAGLEDSKEYPLLESLVVQTGWPPDRVAHYLKTLCIPRENFLDFLRLRVENKL